MDWNQRTQTLNLLSFMSLSRSLSFSARASLSKARAAIIRPLPILRAAPRRRLSFSLFSRGLIGRRVWGASAALPWHPPPKLRRCGLRMTSRSSSFNRSRGSEYNSEELRSVQLQKIFKIQCLRANVIHKSEIFQWAEIYRGFVVSKELSHPQSLS